MLDDAWEFNVFLNLATRRRIDRCFEILAIRHIDANIGHFAKLTDITWSKLCCVKYFELAFVDQYHNDWLRAEVYLVYDALSAIVAICDKLYLLPLFFLNAD